MAKSVTVNFEDGTNHVYENVPDDVTNDQVQERAQKDYPDAKIMDFEHNAASAAPTPAPAMANSPVEPQLTPIDKAVAGAQTVAQVAMEHPGIAAGVAGLYKANQFANKYMAGKDVDRAIAQTQANTAADAQKLARERMAERMARPGAAPTNAVAQPQRPIGFVNTNTPPPGGPTAMQPGAAPTAQPQMGAAQMRPGMAPNAPPVNPMPATPGVTPAGGAPAQQGASFLDNIAAKYGQIASKVAPAMQGLAESPLGRVAGGAMRIAGSAPVMGAQLMAHSAGLNTNEDQLLADKHRLELQMLQNKHAAEWNKYKNVAQ